jgi:hypothetical protein
VPLLDVSDEDLDAGEVDYGGIGEMQQLTKVAPMMGGRMAGGGTAESREGQSVATSSLVAIVGLAAFAAVVAVVVGTRMRRSPVTTNALGSIQSKEFLIGESTVL